MTAIKGGNKRISNANRTESGTPPNGRVKKKRLKWEQGLLFGSAGVSGGDSVLVKAAFSSAIREPEYTALSSQMDRIRPTDLITLRSPSELEKNRKE